MNQPLEDPVFGALTYNSEQGCWQAQVFVTLVDRLLAVDIDAVNKAKPSEEQKRAFKAFNQASVSIRPVFQSALYQHYSYVRKELLAMMPQEEEYFSRDMPPLNQPQQVWDLITPRTLLVLGEEYSGAGNLVLLWDCSWDIEHGLLAIFQDSELIEVGGP